MVTRSISALDLFNQVEEIFEYYRDLERKVTQALSSGENIGRIVEIASKHFHSTVFFHDEYYHILASTNFLQRAANIQYNGRKGVYVQDADVINQFRTSASYQATLSTHGGCL